MTRVRNRAGVGVVAALLCLAPAAQAAVPYTTDGATYSQDFNTLPNTPENQSLGNTPIGWIDDTATPGANQFSIPGWYLFHPVSLAPAEGGANGNQRVRLGAGSANTGAFMSFGASGSSERALGSLASNALAPAGAESFYGARFNNDTGSILQHFTISFRGEQWRNGGGNVAQSIAFDYSLTATSLQDAAATFTDVPSLSFSSLVTSATGAAVDGNANFATRSATISGLNWADGTDLWVRWADLNDAGNDDGFGIDNVSFSATAVPEPASVAVLGIGCFAILMRRRRVPPLADATSRHI